MLVVTEWMWDLQGLSTAFPATVFLELEAVAKEAEACPFASEDDAYMGQIRARLNGCWDLAATLLVEATGSTTSWGFGRTVPWGS